MINQVRKTYERMMTENQRFAAIFMIQAWSGARISEVLQVKSLDVIDSQTVVIRSLKHSRNRIVTLPFPVDYLIQVSKIQYDIFIGINRFQVYRFYKRYGIVMRTKAGFYNKVTHKLRYDYILKIQAAVNDVDVTRDIVGHKARRTTEHYLTKLKQIHKQSK